MISEMTKSNTQIHYGKRFDRLFSVNVVEISRRVYIISTYVGGIGMLSMFTYVCMLFGT